MPNEKYQKLREKIIEACPDILDLKFGCKVKAKEDITSSWTILEDEENKEENDEVKKGDILFFISFGEYKYKNNLILFNGKNNCFFPNKKTFNECYEIIGRPITLCDVLRAVKDKHIYIDNDGIITNECNKNSVGKWDLVKNLDDQKDWVHEFLYNLIFE